MSLLNFILNPKGIIIFTDTIALSKGQPFKYVTKIFPLPHIKTIVCGTGDLDLLVDWYIKIQKEIIANNITTLDKITTSQLIQLHKNNNTTSTIYHFGYDNIISEFVGFAYRSTNMFKSEKLVYGFAVKPGEGVEEMLSELTEVEDQLTHFLSIIPNQKLIDDEKESLNRLGIGGMVISYHMTYDKSIITELYKFSDFKRNYDEMLNNLRNNGGQLF